MHGIRRLGLRRALVGWIDGEEAMIKLDQNIEVPAMKWFINGPVLFIEKGNLDYYILFSAYSFLLFVSSSSTLLALRPNGDHDL